MLFPVDGDLAVQKTFSLYTRGRWVKGLDVFCGNLGGIIFWGSRLARFLNVHFFASFATSLFNNSIYREEREEENMGGRRRNGISPLLVFIRIPEVSG
jgi:hypothetical protein